MIDVRKVLRASGGSFDGTQIIESDYFACDVINLDCLQPLPCVGELRTFDARQKINPNRFAPKLDNLIWYLKVIRGQPNCSKSEFTKNGE